MVVAQIRKSWRGTAKLEVKTADRRSPFRQNERLKLPHTTAWKRQRSVHTYQDHTADEAALVGVAIPCEAIAWPTSHL